MNKVILLGRLVRDPELRRTQAGKGVATVTIAVDRKGKKGEADFIPLVAWEKSAEFLCNYFTKGKQIAVEGHIQVRSYEGKDGKKAYATEVIVENMEFVGKKGEGESQPSGGYNSDWGANIKPNDDDIPF